MECGGLRVEARDWAKLEAEVLRSEMAGSKVLEFEELGSEVLRSVLAEAQESRATRKTWMRNDDRRLEAARLESRGQQDAQSDNEQILVVGRWCRRARR
jgi:hypothetical protein